MKRLIFVILLILCFELVLTKSTEKIKQHRKKTTSIKKKLNSQKSSSKSLINLDLFKSLPTDDLDFIKDVDKQFKLHGDKIKIKIERATLNSTKNSKRTIDGELGYGYQNPHSRYQFSPPKYVIYPYSQRDIPPIPIHHQRDNNHRGRTQITIEPSHAFELKEVHDYPRYNTNHQLYVPAYQTQNDDGYIQYPQQHQHQQEIIEQPQTVTVEPVIVLRIPGPKKYAAHLQALLQQYLELRASHYIKLLQETEEQQQQQQHQYHQHHEQPIIQQQQQHQPEYPAQPEYQQQYEEPQNQDHHPEHHQPQYQPAEQVYEQVRQHHQTEQAQSQQQQQQPEPEQFHIQYEHQQPAQIEEQPAVSQQQEEHHHHHQQPQQPIPTSPQYVYESRPSQQESAHHHTPSVISYQYIRQPIYVPQQQQQQPEQHFMPHQLYGTPHHPIISTPSYLPPSSAAASSPIRKNLIKENSHEHISENNPRHTHTKVIFTNGENNDHSISYPLASITPAPRKYEPSSPTELYNQHTLHYDDESVAASSSSSSQQQHEEYHNDSEIMITQRPFNYHAHAVRQATALKNQKRATSVTAEEQFRKLNKLIDRLKKKDE